MIAILTAAAALAGADALAVTYADLCLRGNPDTAEVLARADRAGWRRGAAQQADGLDEVGERLLDTPAGRLRLGASTKAFKDEKMLGCAIDLAGPDATVVAGMAQVLGIDQANGNADVANFFAIRDGQGWRQGAKADHAEFARAKAAGVFYSFVASHTPTSAMVLGLHFAPIGPAAKPQG